MTTTKNIQTIRKEVIENFWEYWGGDDEWRHYGETKWKNGKWVEVEPYLTIFLHGHREPEVGLRAGDGGEEWIFPDLWSAKVFGFFWYAQRSWHCCPEIDSLFNLDFIVQDKERWEESFES